MKNFAEKIKELFNFIETKDWNFLGLLLCFFLLVGQFSTFAGVLWDSVTSRPILMAYDDDSSYGVETAEKTFLLNHNGSTTYGPIYYRVTWPLKHLFSNPNVYSEINSNQSENRDRNVFFAMLLINLLAVYGSSFLLMRILTRHFGWRALGTLVLVSAFLNNEMRSLLVFMAKPDWLVTFFVTLAMSLLVNFLKIGQGFSSTNVKVENDKKHGIKKLACSWAIALSTKLICIYFLPGFLLIFFERIRKSESIKNFYKFIILVAIFYFIVGFPQNLDLLGYVKYLLQQNRHTSLVDWKFLTEQWIPLFSKDLLLPMLSIFVLATVSVGDSNEAGTINAVQISKDSLLRLFGFVLLPIGLVLIKQTKVPFQWYTFPFVNALLVVFAVLTKKVTQQSWLALNTKLLNLKTNFKFNLGSEKFRAYKLVGVFLITPFVFNFFPNSIYKTYRSRMSCHEDIYNLKKLMDEKLSQGKFVLADPGIPYDLQYHRKFIEPDWEMSLDKLKAKDYKYVALKGSYNMSFNSSTGSSSNGNADNLSNPYDFYKLFREASTSPTLEVNDPFGKKWKRIYHDKCTYEVWEAE